MTCRRPAEEAPSTKTSLTLPLGEEGRPALHATLLRILSTAGSDVQRIAGDRLSWDLRGEEIWSEFES